MKTYTSKDTNTPSWLARLQTRGSSIGAWSCQSYSEPEHCLVQRLAQSLCHKEPCCLGVPCRGTKLGTDGCAAATACPFSHSQAYLLTRQMGWGIEADKRRTGEKVPDPFPKGLSF